MNMSLLLPVLVMLLGLALYLLTNNKAMELGRIGFFVGLLWVTYAFAGVVLSVHAH